jgi:hypothetical protein
MQQVVETDLEDPACLGIPVLYVDSLDIGRMNARTDREVETWKAVREEILV